MRKDEIWDGAALWILVAVLMPMAALEPVAAAPAPVMASLCGDGSARLTMGCESIHL
jgi:hypothetical protein